MALKDSAAAASNVQGGYSSHLSQLVPELHHLCRLRLVLPVCSIHDHPCSSGAVLDVRFHVYVCLLQLIEVCQLEDFDPVPPQSLVRCILGLLCNGIDLNGQALDEFVHL